jgi:hypothetical protein
MKTQTTERLPMIPMNISQELRASKRKGPCSRILWSMCAVAAMIALRVTDAAIFVDEWFNV